MYSLNYLTSLIKHQYKKFAILIDQLWTVGFFTIFLKYFSRYVSKLFFSLDIKTKSLKQGLSFIITRLYSGKGIYLNYFYIKKINSCMQNGCHIFHAN